MMRSEQFSLIVAGIAAVIALAGLVVLLALPAVLRMLRRRWTESFLPAGPPADGAPTARLVAVTGGIWLVGGLVFLVLALSFRSGGLGVPAGADADAFGAMVFGAIALVAGLAAVWKRVVLQRAIHTSNRMLLARPTSEEYLTPGVILGMGIVIAAVGLGVLIYGLAGA